MKKIYVVNQKGGVGKTMLADEITFRLEKTKKENGQLLRVSFIDLDQQGGANHETASFDDADFQVVDTPGALQGDTKKWMADADVVVIPTNCNVHDMIPLQRMMQIAEEFEKDKFIIVFNRWNRFSGTAEFINWFNYSYPGYKTFLIPMSVALTDAAARSVSIADFKPKHKANLALDDFMSLLFLTLGE